MLSSGAARPASGGNQSCPTGIAASLPAVAAGRGHSCSSHRLLCNCGSFMILKIWVLLPALQVLCFLLTGWWTKAGQGWDRQFCWKAGLAYTMMKLRLGRTEGSGIRCLREKIRNKVYCVMERKEIFSWISGLTFVGDWITEMKRKRSDHVIVWTKMKNCPLSTNTKFHTKNALTLTNFLVGTVCTCS